MENLWDSIGWEMFSLRLLDEGTFSNINKLEDAGVGLTADYFPPTKPPRLRASLNRKVDVL